LLKNFTNFHLIGKEESVRVQLQIVITGTVRNNGWILTIKEEVF